ncbi:solute carrier family 5 (high affinity choline transporter), member 7 [Actinopolyspora alba]|uniref:Solute carrier family 5 (High affinity choline transporter), member 7 n=2 Tax=Actinopolyspora alba TaxID=673379 RepID=A0A1I2A801_9ACTN|nr:solute carrier family 5 (high affinity choline transporter), member 7 [Actinopolyspora alba]
MVSNRSDSDTEGKNVPAETRTNGDDSTRPPVAHKGKKGMVKIGIFVIVLAFALTYVALAEPNVSWPGLIAMLAFYALFYWLGAFVAARRGGGLGDTMVAGRNMPLWIGVFTMTATWVGGGYISGTAESTFSSGLAWAQAPWGYAVSLLIGGLFFAKKMRRGRFTTMLDPIDIRFGKKVAGLGAIPAILGEIFWTGAILTALGTTFGTIIGLDFTVSIILSAVIAVAYTVVGGMWSVAITDVVQVVVIFIGLIVAVPFAASAVGGLGDAWAAYPSNFDFESYASLFPPLTGWDDPAWGHSYWNWWDAGIALVLGGIPWQVYFQRVLSSSSPKNARRLSVGASVMCVLAAIPPVLIGVVATAANFQAEGAPPLENPSMVLPYVLRYLLPTGAAALGLGVLAAAVMSSVDSSVLSASSLTGWNVYRRLVRPKAGPEQVQKVIRRLIVIIGAAATLMALQANSVYDLWYLASDLIFVMLFPLLVCALFVPFANRIGATAGFAVAVLLRFSAGEDTFGLAPVLPWPWYEDGAVLFPFRTVTMVAALLTIIVVSALTRRKSEPVPMAALEPDTPERARWGNDLTEDSDSGRDPKDAAKAEV